MLIKNVLDNPGSTTKLFKSLTNNFVLEMLSIGEDDNQIFWRITLIKLDNVPVMLNVCKTRVDNIKFKNILYNINIPIGEQLFAPNSGISRGDINVKEIEISSIYHLDLVQYLKQINLMDKLYFRQSKFFYKDEVMELEEYALPGLQDILNKYAFKLRGNYAK